jgi:hypothetical protein
MAWLSFDTLIQQREIDLVTNNELELSILPTNILVPKAGR